MDVKQAQDALAAALKDCDEYRDFEQARQAAFQDELSGKLLTEFSRLQTKLQMFAVTGREADQSEVERFRQMSGLLYATPATSAYLMAQIRLQKRLTDVFAALSEAVGMPIELPRL